MKRFLFFACLGCMLIGMASCKKSDKTEDVVNEITIYGNVIDRATGQPLFNVLIKEKNKVGGSTVTGNDGNYEFTLPLNGSSSGMYYLIASKDKYSSSEYELNMSNVDKNRRVKVDFQLVKESITYTGTVVDSQNKPIFDAHISAQYSNSSGDGKSYSIGTTTMTDANGVYTLELPRPGSYDQWKFAITATKSSYVSLTHTLNQNVDDMGKIITLNFVMKSNMVTISGKVVDQDGKPIANAYISDGIFRTGTWNSDGQYYYNFQGYQLLSTTQSDANGNYTLSSITSLLVGGYYSRNHEYECTKDGYKAQWQYFTTSDEDGGNSYNIDFKLTKL